MENGIEQVALKYLGRKYEKGFRCMDFVRLVYKEVGMTLPPVALNVKPADISDPPVGHVLFLRHIYAPSKIGYTHVGIIISGRRCIHNSYYFGGKVVVTPLDELLQWYKVV